MIESRRVSRIVAYLVLVTSILGCTSMRPLAISDGYTARDQVEVGDYVRVTLADNSEHLFKIDSKTEVGIGGEGRFVEFADIQHIDVKKFSSAKTIGLVAAAVLVLAIVGENSTYGSKF